MFMKKLGVAAALILCTFSASASNFRAADQVYVPVAGHAGGSSGLFISDAYISNLTADTVDVSVIYVPRDPNSGGVAPKNLEEIRGRITLRPFERKEFLDIFVNALGKDAGFGLLIFNGCKANTSCGVDTQDQFGDSPNFRNISVQTRIYQVTPQRPGETTGQLFSGIPWYNFVSRLQSNVELDKVFITGLTNTGSAGQAGTFGNQLYGFDDLFRQSNGDVFRGSNFFVVVSQRGGSAVNNPPEGCVDGCPAFLCYGSVLDNVSGDATTMEAQYMVPMSQDVLDVLYPVGSGKKRVRRAARH
jgi:hypothetical protein